MMMTDEAAMALNNLAREQLKLRILADDISVDLMVCDLEGLDPAQYVRELREMLGEIAAKLDSLQGGS